MALPIRTIIMIKVFIRGKILSGGTILSAHPPTQVHTLYTAYNNRE